MGETAEQRRLRERNRVEEADNDLTEDLFGGGSAGGKRGGGDGLSGLALKNMQVGVWRACVRAPKVGGAWKAVDSNGSCEPWSPVFFFHHFFGFMWALCLCCGAA